MNIEERWLVYRNRTLNIIKVECLSRDEYRVIDHGSVQGQPPPHGNHGTPCLLRSLPLCLFDHHVKYLRSSGPSLKQRLLQTGHWRHHAYRLVDSSHVRRYICHTGTTTYLGT